MNYKKAKKIRGSIYAIPSKSYLIRALLLATLSVEPVKIKCLYMSNDVINALDVIKEMGATYEINGDEISVIPPKTLKKEVCVSVGESATLLRLIIPILSILGINATINAEGSLIIRNVTKNFDILRENGAVISNDFPIKVSGEISNFDFDITDYSTSGVVSGLIVALCFSGGKITLKKDKINGGYIDITCDILRDFSADILESSDGYIIKKSTFKCDEYYIEGDYSNASAFLSLGGLLGECRVKNLQSESVQPDRKVIDILRKFGIEINVLDNCIVAKRNTLNGIEIDVSKNLDIVPVLAVVASFVNGKSVFKNIENLIIKESDRAKEIVKMLDDFGVKAEITKNDLIIYGGTGKAGDYFAPNDHRMVMAGVMMALLYGGNVENIECVKKSYPTFFEDIEKLEICYE